MNTAECVKRRERERKTARRGRERGREEGGGRIEISACLGSC